MMQTMDGRDTMTRLWSPRPAQMDGALGEAAARCLSSAFSAGEWARTPMPLGDASDPHSARGIIAQLGDRAQVLIAEDVGDRKDRKVFGCVVGAVLDRPLIEAYRLGAYGARHGDAVLAYIGLDPVVQGSRAFALSNSRFALSPRHSGLSHTGWGQSLVGLLFARWLALPSVDRCPQVFVRTRRVLAPILHLIEKNGFHFRGEFELDFHGEQQDRIVFGRHNARPLPPPVEGVSLVRQLQIRSPVR